MLPVTTVHGRIAWRNMWDGNILLNILYHRGPRYAHNVQVHVVLTTGDKSVRKYTPAVEIGFYT